MGDSLVSLCAAIKGGAAVEEVSDLRYVLLMEIFLVTFFLLFINTVFGFTVSRCNYKL